MIKFSEPMVKGKLLTRYKRFLADVELETGEIITAHCPNTGSMKSCGEKGDTVYLTKNDSPKRKLKYTWQFTETTHGLIGINTILPNKVVGESLNLQQVPELAMYNEIQAEVKIGNGTRLDFLCSDSSQNHPDCYVEVKNATLFLDGSIQFPDAVTLRGEKHLKELIKLKKQGARAVIFFFVNRAEGSCFRIADQIDPAYTQAFLLAQRAGVEVLIYRSQATLQGLTLGPAVSLQKAFHFENEDYT